MKPFTSNIKSSKGIMYYFATINFEIAVDWLLDGMDG